MKHLPSSPSLALQQLLNGRAVLSSALLLAGATRASWVSRHHKNRTPDTQRTSHRCSVHTDSTHAILTCNKRTAQPDGTPYSTSGTVASLGTSGPGPDHGTPYCRPDSDHGFPLSGPSNTSP